MPENEIRNVQIEIQVRTGPGNVTHMSHQITIPSISEPTLGLIEDILIRVLDSIR